MRSARLSVFSIIAFAALLSQSTVFAVDHQNFELVELHKSAEASKAYPLGSEPGGKRQLHGFDVEKQAPLKPGQFLPFLYIHAGGEISVSDNGVVKKPWSSKSLVDKGRVQLVQYVASNLDATRQNQPFNDILKEKQFSSEQLSTTIIVQTKNKMALIKAVVIKKLAKNKAKYDTVNFVIDDEGVGLQRWGIGNNGGAIFVLDARGEVLFAKDGPLSETEIRSTIELIERQMS